MYRVCAVVVGACDEAERLRVAVIIVADILPFEVVVGLRYGNFLDSHSFTFVVG